MPLRSVALPSPPEDADTIAAVDLGSNSFHMIIADVSRDEVQIVDRLRETVRLAAGLDAHNVLGEEAAQRGLDCLRRFGQRVHELPLGAVRAVGTNTLRSAHNGAGFLAAAEEALGHPIEIIAGREEARLIYLGVAHSRADDRGRRLVMDIGGGSTELIIGERFEAQHRESLYMGCVSSTRHYFPDGKLTEGAMRAAEIAAHLELESIERRYRRIGWDHAIGASGTIKAVGATLEANGWAQGGITFAGLQRLRKALLKAGSIGALGLPGLGSDRAAVFPGGVAILLATFEALSIEHMAVSEGALREGLLYDLLGRIRHEDVRARTTRAMAKRYDVARKFAQRVADTALACLQQVARDWQLEGEQNRNMLMWAAQLHEVGLAIAHNQYHKHGAYIVRHSDMPGFSRQEQAFLAALIRGHRRKFPKSELQELAGVHAETARRLCVLLRLAVLLNHGRNKAPPPPLTLHADGSTLELLFAEGWLAEHPLTLANLEREADYLKAAKLTLRFQ
jgi:exopolyphosphatase/guanosine-5'-triphosphate,3'-diphosphate pyrophosphatase